MQFTPWPIATLHCTEALVGPAARNGSVDIAQGVKCVGSDTKNGDTKNGS